jgi:hypothetical protein
VTLAIGALLALSGSRPLVVGDEDLLRLCGLDPWRGPGAAGRVPSALPGSYVVALRQALHGGGAVHSRRRRSRGRRAGRT